jgi:S-adenosylmethionine:tRNA ribosyltransferase-isomerase
LQLVRWRLLTWRGNKAVAGGRGSGYAAAMKVDLFDFDLPEDRIALRPADPRDTARLLVVKPGEKLADRTVRDLPSLLRAGDVLVFNDTKVIPAQLRGLRRRGDNVAQVEATLHMRTAPDRWLAFMRPGKRVAAGDRIHFGHDGNSCFLGQLDATVLEKHDGGEALLGFDLSGAFLDEALHAVGHIPLPPYIASKRDDDARDLKDYQTVYAREEGAVAAPTAGLHFTPDLMAALDAAGIERRFVTLHVGAGTFLPVKADDTADHKMHAEIGTVSPETAAALNAARAGGGRIVAVGTTSLRLLESAAREDGSIAPWSGPTDIFITPGYRFRTADMLMTNFHLPRSTLFMLVSAFSGLDTMREAYRHAIETGYRFYSYGDSSLLFRHDSSESSSVQNQ